MKARKIVWRIEAKSIGSTSFVGRAGRIKVFSIHWDVTLNEHKEFPYILQFYLILLKKKRFKTEDEAKNYAIKGFESIVSELVEK